MLSLTGEALRLRVERRGVMVWERLCFKQGHQRSLEMFESRAPKTVAAEERRRAALLPGMEECAIMLGLPPGSGGKLLDQMEQYWEDAVADDVRERNGLPSSRD